MDLKSKIFLIAGPTASGKSNFAIKLAKKINGEIINADSMQIYKEFQILTSRPKKIDQNNIKHHLYGLQSIKKKFSTGAWLKLTIKKINEIQKKNKKPILVGGTGLYFKSLTEGLVKIPNIPLKKRNEIRMLQKKLGQKNFYKKLVKLDPLIKDYLNPNDAQRSIRAYEIKKFTKISMISWFKNTKKFFKKDDFIKMYIDFPRQELIERIVKRTKKMISDGAINEVRRFTKLNIKKDNIAFKIIGIQEILKFLRHESSLREVKDQISIKTRQYAKRQITWARGQMGDWQKIQPQDLKLVVKKF